MPRPKYTSVKVESGLFRKARAAGRRKQPPTTGQGMVNLAVRQLVEPSKTERSDASE